MNKEEFINELRKLGITLRADGLDKLNIYYEQLVSENEKYNLTTITNENDVYLKHFYDSLTIIKEVNLQDQSICDIGTGAGFPGIVLKIVYPNLKLTLIESSNKKCNFLKTIVDKLNLDNVTIINQRIEEYGRTNREIFDIVTSRAVASLKVLLELAVPLVKINGYFIPLKANIDDEVKDIDKYYKKLSIKLISITKFELPNEKSKRTIIKYKKIEKTNNRYPRKYKDIISKEI